jgi:uncharacterized protein YuzE
MGSRSSQAMIRTSYDPESDVLNVRFGPADAASDGHQEVAPGVYIEFDRAGQPIGVEITSVHQRQKAKVAAE